MQSPLFEPLYAELAQLDENDFPALADMNRLFEKRQPPIVTQSGCTVRLVPQSYGRLPFEEQYEPRCYLTGGVQSRERNWHDLFNALVWLVFPKAKAAINARHYRAIVGGGESPGSSQRGSVRDTNTLFDESGVIVPYADEEMAGLLLDFSWKKLFWQRRTRLAGGMGFYLFGHGLYEKALAPYIGFTGQGLLVRVEPAFFEWPLAQRLTHLDELLAVYLNDPLHCRNTRELTPVPLLGIPGWSCENEAERYYENAAYFRHGRQSLGRAVDIRTSKREMKL